MSLDGLPHSNSWNPWCPKLLAQHLIEAQGSPTWSLSTLPPPQICLIAGLWCDQNWAHGSWKICLCDIMQLNSIAILFLKYNWLENAKIELCQIGKSPSNQSVRLPNIVSATTSPWSICWPQVWPKINSVNTNDTYRWGNLFIYHNRKKQTNKQTTTTLWHNNYI